MIRIVCRSDRCVYIIVTSQLREFSEADLDAMTGGFQTMIGRGSFGSVYKGVYGHTAVAVKVIEPVSVCSMCPFASCVPAFVIQTALQDVNKVTFTTELNSLTRCVYA